MSLPLTRRIARAALLVGAAAAPLVGAGAASAAELPQAAGLGGLTSPDKTADLGRTVEGTAKKAATDARKSAAPAVGKATRQAGSAVKGADTTALPQTPAPALSQLPDLAAGQLPSAQLPAAQLPSTGGLPIGG